MSNLPQTSLGRYQYTALDKLSTCTLGAQPGSQRFYLGERLSTEIKGAVQHSVMQNGEQLLAQQQRQAGTLHTYLLATDQQRSVLTLLDASHPQHLAYSPYGHRAPENGLLSLLGFNGERPDPLTGWYLLGNGYRAFNPVLMRFISPDNLSPFGEGGLNAYGYCVGDPINRVDPTGHMFKFKPLINVSARGSNSSLNSTSAIATTSSNVSAADPIGSPSIAPKKTNWITKQWTNWKRNKLNASIEDRESRLDRVTSELNELKENPERVAFRIAEANYDPLFPENFLEARVRKKIPARIDKLEKKTAKHNKKLDELNRELSQIRQ